ncbi:hypothetical protein VPNG_00851 [Cytospora leucostoma]|uniref:Uncharacterized protein n=1 Tax=Cytospora leucostoma TaxID=1230097 RepID=A0A423XMF2_9PEZI|nr:hypothetical protein VPNG_00851 [Cytospora leucostoma]
MTSLYDVSVPVLTNVLKTASSVLAKAEDWSKQNGFATSDLLELKVYHDMFPLKYQVLIMVNVTRLTLERLTGVAHPTTDDFDNFKTLEELYAVIDETLGQASAVGKRETNEREGVQVSCEFFSKEYTARLVDYVHGYAIPTVYFHLSILYAILRGKGVPLGKWDYQTEFFKVFSPASETGA